MSLRRLKALGAKTLTNANFYFIVDDQIQSATTLGKLAYTMPSIDDFFGGVDMTTTIHTAYLANKDENLNFQLQVANTAEATDSVCPKGSESKCEVRYNLRYTPWVYDIVPNQVYFD